MIYLDNAATSFPKPPQVLETMRVFAETMAGNPGRSGHKLAVAAEKAVDRARSAVARLLHAPDASRIAFTLNGSDALNIALKGVIRPGDHVVTTTCEHNSINRPLTRMEKEGAIAVTRVAPRQDLTIDPGAVRRACTNKTRLVAVTACSNVLGALNDVAAIARAAHDTGAKVLIDAAQAVGAADLDVQGMDLDLVAFPGHKGLLGPMGTGTLYVKPGLEVAPWREGATGTSSEIELHPHTMPHALEAGTANAHGLAGLAAGVEFVLAVSPGRIRQHETDLARAFLESVRGAKGVRILNWRNPAASLGLVTLTIDGRGPAEVAKTLDAAYDIAVRAGLHCAPGSHRTLGTLPQGAVRLSFGWYNTAEEVDAAAKAVRDLAG